jgi:hypothetical protein
VLVYLLYIKSPESSLNLRVPIKRRVQKFIFIPPQINFKPSMQCFLLFMIFMDSIVQYFILFTERTNVLLTWSSGEQRGARRNIRFIDLSSIQPRCMDFTMSTLQLKLLFGKREESYLEYYTMHQKAGRSKATTQLHAGSRHDLGSQYSQ